MLPRIRPLADAVVNKIAAGEVIERPASVVKELLENSVDAGATRIEIDVENGGHDLIRITDDGCGIHPEDLPLAFRCHATSKLTEADDLFSLDSFGFRGEALASVGGVAKVSLYSRTRDAAVGASLRCEGSTLTEVTPWAGPVGTRIEVRELFFNAPVRRGFLRSPATEIGHISEAVIRLALSRARDGDKPGLHLVLRHNGKAVHEVAASATLADRVGLFFGSDVRKALYAVEGQGGPVRLRGFVADPACDRGNARLQYLFVNGRWVRDRSLSHAMQDAFRGLLMTGRYCVAFLFLDMPPDHVDVNVHPTKAEVRFKNGPSLHHLIHSSVKTRLRAENLVSRFDAGKAVESSPIVVESAPEPFAPVLPEPSPSATFRPPIFTPPAPRSDFRVVAPEVPRRPATVTPPPVVAPRPPADVLPLDRPEPPRVLQLYDAYLVLETGEGMMVIDQHALHERILYDQFSRRIRSGCLETQALLIPEPIDLPGDGAGRALEHRDALAELGMGIEDFGGGTILLTRYPALLGRKSPRAALLAVIDHLLNRDRAPSREALFNDMLSLMACHAAVRAGERLTAEQMNDLLAMRHLAEDHHHCPHGRPTALLFTRHDLERQFRRA